MILVSGDFCLLRFDMLSQLDDLFVPARNFPVQGRQGLASAFKISVDLVQLAFEYFGIMLACFNCLKRRREFIALICNPLVVFAQAVVEQGNFLLLRAECLL